ncbi:hypothetical protein FQA39_LY03911 [Lamprigera yunnana]|nr:hypothetical protein FQA39_LY03911 [Lamprigera yunnana]
MSVYENFNSVDKRSFASIIENLNEKLNVKDDEIIKLNAVIKKRENETALVIQSNVKLKNRMDENLNESVSMERTLEEENSKLNEENSKLVGLIFNSKMENKNLTKEIVKIKGKLSHIKLPKRASAARNTVSDSCTQTSISLKKSGKVNPTRSNGGWILENGVNNIATNASVSHIVEITTETQF